MAAKTQVEDPWADADSLNAGLGDGPSEDDFAGVDDLLDSVVEDDSEGWNPKEVGESLAGVVVRVGVTRSDFAADGQDPTCPTVTVQTRDGSKYRVIGFGSVLKRELNDANPEIGDLIAVKYFGEKPIKNGKFAGRPYRHYQLAVKKARK